MRQHDAHLDTPFQDPLKQKKLLISNGNTNIRPLRKKKKKVVQDVEELITIVNRDPYSLFILVVDKGS